MAKNYSNTSKNLRMDSIHRRKKIRVRTEIQHLIQVQ